VKTVGKLFRTTAFKLSLAYFVLFSLGAWLVLTGVGRRVEQVLDEQVAETIDAEIARLTELYGEGGLRQLVASVERRARAPGGSIFIVSTAAGEYIAGNIVASPMLAAQGDALDETIYRRRGEGEEILHHALARLVVLPGGFRLLVGHDIGDHRVLRRILRQGLGESLLWLALVGTLGGLFVAYRLLERVDAMSASARRIMAGDLDQRLEETGAGDELDRLAENLNAMLARIGELMTGLREVSDNIAHDLKTPLTRLRNRAEEISRADASAEETRAALGGIIAESEALIRVFDALLTIARAEAGYSSDMMTDVDAGEIAADIVELYEPLAEEQGAQLHADVGARLMVRGNRELLGQALVNLVDNALKYGAEAEKPAVLVSARRVGGSIEICVADQGPGVPPQDRERVIGRFVRLESSRSRPGSGLGLSLAAAVARLHHGSLRLEDNAPGLRVVVSLPAAGFAHG
jgi:signal transduction histidine kinase